MGKREITKNTLIFASATLASRILGFVRDILIASLFGASPLTDAFFVAFRIPNLFRRLLGEGALSSAFIPLFARCEQEGKDLKEVINSAFTSLLIILCLLLALGETLTPLLVRAIAPGFSPNSPIFGLTVRLTRITFPYIFFMGTAILIGAALNYKKDFFYTSLSPCLLNISFIFFMLFLIRHFKEPIFCLAWAVFAGGIAQMIFHLYGAYRLDLLPSRLTKPFSEDVITAIKLMGPATVGLAIHQINTLVDTIIASLLPEASISYLYYANRLFQLPLALFGIATGAVLLPYASELVAKGERQKLTENARFSNQFVLFITLPAAIGLMLLAYPISDTLFRRGAFGVEASRATALALSMYAVGLPAVSMTKIAVSLFHAHMDMKTPVKAAGIALIVNIALNLLLMHPLKHAGLALATSIAGYIQLLYLYHRLKNTGIHPKGLIPEQIPKIAFLNATLVILLLILRSTIPYRADFALHTRILYLSAGIIPTAVIYLSLGILLRIEAAKLLLYRSRRGTS